MSKSVLIIDVLRDFNHKLVSLHTDHVGVIIFGLAYGLHGFHMSGYETAFEFDYCMECFVLF